MAGKCPWTIGLANADDFSKNKFDRFSEKVRKKLELLIKLTFRGQIEILKVDSRVVSHADPR